MIGIINYGMGNLASVKNALDFLSIKSVIIETAAEIAAADKLILPGVGAFGMAMNNLDSIGFSDAIRETVLVKKKPILGICLGMQLLLNKSVEHGIHSGLALVDGEVLFMGDVLDEQFTVPHIGWNEVHYTKDALLYKNNISDPVCYFVHSYYCSLDNANDVAGITSYGIDFHSSLEHENIFGCQFHPEKSQKDGLNILKNFNEL